MALPTDRDSFKQWCLRQLGDPVIKIDVSQQQVDDAVDYALKYYADYHFDGTEQCFYKHQITSEDQVNKYITVPDNIIGAIEFFNISDPGIRADDIFSIRYQIALNDLYSLTSVSMVPYYMTMQQLALYEQLLVGMQPIRYNRLTNKVYLDTDWNTLPVNSYLLLRCYSVIDPTEYPKVWADRWLLHYAAAQIKLRWGNNITKFSNVQMAGGVTLNGDRILTDAQNEITKLESEMINSYSLPNYDMIN